MIERPPYHSCPACSRLIDESPGAINLSCSLPECPEGINLIRPRPAPFLLSDTFLIRATFCMVLFVFMIMASWYVVEIFGVTQ